MCSWETNCTIPKSIFYLKKQRVLLTLSFKKQQRIQIQFQQETDGSFCPCNKMTCTVITQFLGMPGMKMVKFYPTTKAGAP